MRGTRWGILNSLGMALVGLVFALLLAGSAWALTFTDCGTCHSASVVASHHDPDVNSDYSKGNCELCHVGITTGNDCSSCHQPTGFANPHHDGGYACAGCHVKAPEEVGADGKLVRAGDPATCSICHKGDVPLPRPPKQPIQMRTFHHTRLTADIYKDASGKLDCTGCHPDAELTSNCTTSTCHAEGSTVYRNRHHNYIPEGSTSKPACTSCHTRLKPTTGSCRDCHAPRAKLGEHHAFTGTIECAGCHSAFPEGTAGTGCGNCHQPSNNQVFHHDTVMPTLPTPACNECHKNAVAVAGCGTCHTGSIQANHHTPMALGNPATCKTCHSSASYNQPGCATCHPFLNNRGKFQSQKVANKHHSQENIDTFSCVGACHWPSTSPIIPEKDCFDCHEFLFPTENLVTYHHSTAPYAGNACSTCHAGISVSGLDCSGCHSAGSQKPATPAAHHTAAAADGIACLTCHQKHGIAKTDADACSDCHTVSGTNPAQNHHQKTVPGTTNPYDCLYCHNGAQNITQDCKGCHEKYRDAATGRTITVTSGYWHHNGNYKDALCSTCHKSVDDSSLQQDCSACHVGAGKPAIAERHHETADAVTEKCSVRCHINTEPAKMVDTYATPAGNITGPICWGCHPTGAERHHNKTVIVNSTVQPKPCADCHTIKTDGASCDDAVGCHTLPMAEFHHDDGPDGPLTKVGGNCAVCHTTINNTSTCANCHASSPHHTTTWSQAGDCAHCHLVPASAADRPTQAACRECHGTAMHGKGGPIKSYGACAACHNTTPFHGEPGIIPDGSESRAPTNTGAGRGKFNMFMARNSAQGQEGKWQPNTKLIFSTKSISHDGKSYTVPYFTGASVAIVNLALGKTASASGAESGYSASLVVDGNASSTRWWKKSTSTQTLTVDLGASKNINKVTVRWHTYFAKSYQVQTATSSYGPWTTVYSTTAGDGGVDERSFTARSARYVRINCQKTPVVNNVLSPNGYSIYELEVYAP